MVWFLVNDRVKLAAYRIFSSSELPLLAKKPIDVAPKIAKRAYELYKQQGLREGHTAQDWLQAERDVWEDESHN
jgi:hypothetical protein